MADVTVEITQARTLISTFLTLNPSAADRSEVDTKLAKCQGIYEAENVVDLPLVTHVASQVCYDELISTLTSKIAALRAAQPGLLASFPWWGYVAIGGGGLLVLGTLFALFSSRSQPVVVRGKAS